MTSSSEPSSAPSAAASTHLFRTYRETPVVWVFGVRMRILVDSAETAGRFSLVEVYTPPFDPGPPLHAHHDCEELFHILEGGLRLTLAGQSGPITARPGDTLIVPRGMLHTVSNPFLTPCRHLVQLTPGGFERFFAEIGVPPVSGTDLLRPPATPPPSKDQLRALAIKHHMSVPGVTD
jgi:mannose-6-phosphate isomerase-like protein (cupin superfamily)